MTAPDGPNSPPPQTQTKTTDATPSQKKDEIPDEPKPQWNTMPLSSLTKASEPQPAIKPESLSETIRKVNSKIDFGFISAYAPLAATEYKPEIKTAGKPPAVTNASIKTEVGSTIGLGLNPNGRLPNQFVGSKTTGQVDLHLGKGITTEVKADAYAGVLHYEQPGKKHEAATSHVAPDLGVDFKTDTRMPFPASFPKLSMPIGPHIVVGPDSAHIVTDVNATHGLERGESASACFNVIKTMGIEFRQCETPWPLTSTPLNNTGRHEPKGLNIQAHVDGHTFKEEVGKVFSKIFHHKSSPERA